MRAFECDGIWWLPTAPSDTVAGRLGFSDESGITLSLSGVFGSPAHSFDEKLAPIVVGTAWDCPHGREFTLERCRLAQSSVSVPGFHRETYSARRLYAGAQLENLDSLSFSGVNVELSGLPSWADSLTGLAKKQLRPRERAGDRFELTWSRPQPYEGPVPGGRLKLGVRVTSSWGERGGTIEESVECSIDCDRPTTAEELYARYVYPLRNWIIFATGQPSTLVQVLVRRPDVRTPIRIFIPQGVEPSRGRDVRRHEMLFTLDDVRERVVELMARWIEISETHKDAYAPFFAIQYSRDTFLELAFLAVFQSLERAQQLQFTEARAPQPLGELVRAFLQEHWDIMGPLFGEQLEPAVEDVISARRYVVHRDLGVNTDRNTALRIYWLTEKLTLLIKAKLLTLLGFTAGDSAKIIKGNYLYSRILNSVERASAPSE